MKRNYLLSGILTLTAASMLTLGITAAPAEGWHRVGGKARVQTATPKDQLKKSRKMQYMLQAGKGTVTAPFQSADGNVLKTTPSKLKLRPHSMRSIENPRGNIFGVVNRWDGMVYAYQAYMGKIDLNSGKFTTMHQGNVWCNAVGNDYTFQTNGYRMGKVYCPIVTESIEAGGTVWAVVDLEDGDIEARYDFGTDLQGWPYSLTYNADEDVFYGLTIGQGSDSHFVIYYPKNFKETGLNGEDDGSGTGAYKYVKHIGDDATYMAAVVYNPLDKQLYAFDQRNNGYIIDTETGERTELGFLNFDGNLFPELYSGQICYSPMDEQFVALYRDNAEMKTAMLFIDPASLDVTELGYIDDERSPYVASIFTNDDFASADAPELPAEFVFGFDKASLSGKLTFTVPSLTYYGVEIGSTPVKMSVKMDDKVLYEGTMKAGESKTLDVTTTDGLHTFTSVATIGENASPVRTMVKYIGNDVPFAPTDLYLDNDKLTWKAPAGVGINKGYVNVDALEYNVYIDGVMQNSTPIEDCEYTLTLPASAQRSDIAVEALCKGKKSECAVLNQVIGKGLKLPVAYTPTREESQIFTAINANNDERTWVYNTRKISLDDMTSDIKDQGMSMILGYYNDADDWLVFPAINFDSAQAVYNLAFKLASVYTGGSEESFAIYIGKKPTVKALKEEGTLLYQRSHFHTTNDLVPVSVDFAVPAAGDYYIGIHCYSSKGNDAWGMYVSQINVSKGDGSATGLPGPVEKVELVAAPLGDMYADAKVTLPSVDINGKALDPNTEITVTIANDADERSTVGKPGQTVDLTCDVNRNGFSDFVITPSTASGLGYSREYRIYVGTDEPLAPTNIAGVVSEDNMSMHVTWDKVGEVGYNKGYVNPDNVSYIFYIRNGVAYQKIGETKDTQFNFEPNNPKMSCYIVGPSAINEASESSGTKMLQVDLGTPYEAPCKENFNSAKFDLPSSGGVTIMTDGAYAGSSWTSTSAAESLYEGCTVNQGGIFCYSTTGGYARGKFYCAKVSTLGIDKCNFILRYWDCPDTPELHIWGRNAKDQKERLVHTFVPERPAKGKWVDASFAIPEDFNNATWSQFAVDFEMTGARTEYVVFDSYQYFPDSEWDLAITGMTGMSQASIGDVASFNIRVTNAGAERHSGTLTTDLVAADGKVIMSKEETIKALTANQVAVHNVQFDLDGSVADYDKLTVRAKITCDPDENTKNSQRELTLEIMKAPVPVVKDLAGVKNDNGGVDFTWGNPVSTYGGFENFEYQQPFKITDQIGVWKNYDFDKLQPLHITQGNKTFSWEGSNYAQGWTVVDAKALGLMEDPRINPFSGKQYLVARSADIPEGANPKEYKSDKWLVSPEVKGGSIVSFWMTTFTSSVQYVEIWYSETGTQVSSAEDPLRPNVRGDFKKFGTTAISKSGVETWEQIVRQLPRRAKYFAIRYVDYDGIAVIIDDIKYEPVEMLTSTVDHYTLYRSDNGGKFEKVADDIKGNSYTDASFPDSKAHYYLVANAEVNGAMYAGPKSNDVYIAGSSVNEINGKQSIVGGKGEIVIIGLEGREVSIYTTDGKTAYKGNVRSGHAAIGVDAGIYLVKIADGKSVKVIVR